jgi:hypothetical protein
MKKHAESRAKTTPAMIVVIVFQDDECAIPNVQSELAPQSHVIVTITPHTQDTRAVTKSYPSLE